MREMEETSNARGPAAGKRPAGGYSAAAVAAEHWGDAAPDWVRALAKACDETSNRVAAEAIGRSASVISQVLRRSYPGSMEEVERRVRGAFMDLTVDCPIEGEISTAACARFQDMPRPNGDARLVRIFRACRSGCPHSRLAPYDHVQRRKG